MIERRREAVAPTKSGKGRAVGDRMIGYDLCYLRAVLNWATMASDDRGGVLLERNPLKGLALPTEESPTRSVPTTEQYDALRSTARTLGDEVELMLVVAHETGHRIGSVRRLRWADIDLDRRTVIWRAENDKIGFAHETPLSEEAVAQLARARRQQPPSEMHGCFHRRRIAANRARGTERVISLSDSEIERRYRKASDTDGIHYAGSSPVS